METLEAVSLKFRHFDDFLPGHRSTSRTMRSSNVFSSMLGIVVVALALFGMPGYAVPQTAPAASATAVANSGGGSSSGPGKPVTGCGIPNVTNAVNSVCIPWYGIRDTIMSEIFEGRCGDNARAAVRLTFHDAGTFSQELQNNGLPNGAADGSLLVDPNEVLRSENNGLQNIVSLLRPLPAQFGVSPGDIIQIAGILAVLACPGGPAVTAFVGRAAPLNIAPTGLLPSPEDPVAKLVARFADMGLSSRDMIALIGAHTTGTQQFVDPAKANFSFDTTDTIWDTRFYTQTADNTTVLPDVFKLDSDVAFSTDPSTSGDFNRFIGQQSMWQSDYVTAHKAMSILGQNPATLTDCSEILPASIDLTPLEETTTTTGAGGGGGGGGGQPVTDPAIDPTLLEAAIELQRGPWLNPPIDSCA
ncbi:Peroxidase [Mycena sanguinolenta]|uniref:Peroxidase n=1 Tax=Mycena sanguinolenta TaxID=230812 RepID=A0A8H6YF51_9AGAR|nr:Peroxidase [Mycena sanguinolenta]